MRPMSNGCRLWFASRGPQEPVVFVRRLLLLGTIYQESQTACVSCICDHNKRIHPVNQTEGKRVVPVKTGVKARRRLNEDETLGTDLAKSVLLHSSPQHLPQCLAGQGIHNNSLYFLSPYHVSDPQPSASTFFLLCSCCSSGKSALFLFPLPLTKLEIQTGETLGLVTLGSVFLSSGHTSLLSIWSVCMRACVCREYSQCPLLSPLSPLGDITGRSG